MNETEITYARTKGEIVPLIQEEIARVAASIRNAVGGSLFDEIIYHSQDEGRLWAFAEQAASQLRSRLHHIDETGAAVTNVIQMVFNVPDMPTNLRPLAISDITDYIVYHATASWLINKNVQDYGAEYTARAKSAADLAVSHILTRSTNSRIS